MNRCDTFTFMCPGFPREDSPGFFSVYISMQPERRHSKSDNRTATPHKGATTQHRRYNSGRDGEPPHGATQAPGKRSAQHRRYNSGRDNRPSHPQHRYYNTRRQTGSS